MGEISNCIIVSYHSSPLYQDSDILHLQISLTAQVQAPIANAHTLRVVEGKGDIELYG